MNQDPHSFLHLQSVVNSMNGIENIIMALYLCQFYTKEYIKNAIEAYFKPICTFQNKATVGNKTCMICGSFLEE